MQKLDTFALVSGGLTPERPGEAMLPATRSAWLVEHLRQSLLDGRYPPGSRLNEVHLSQELDVSRTPVRAALQTLAGEGLLHHQPNKGFTVREFLLTELVEAYDMRALAEGLAARFSAERGLSDDARRTIDNALSDGDRTLSGSDDLEAQRAAYAQMNQAFHGAFTPRPNRTWCAKSFAFASACRRPRPAMSSRSIWPASGAGMICITPSITRFWRVSPRKLSG
ncbi:MAG: GntR family transcriptional regulator [Bradyrhizobium sp.]